MGGETIRNILEAAPWTRCDGRRLILQPMTKPELLRLWLSNSGYAISGEKLVKEAGVIYPIILASGGKQPPMTRAELYTGRWGLISEDPLLGEYLEQLASKTGRAIKGLERSKRAEDRVRLDKLREAFEGFYLMRKKLISKREGKDDSDADSKNDT
jgi:tRNA (adenine22-N1)-methyltransferase